jgi:GNAT superfamily N-acetyltransferase
MSVPRPRLAIPADLPAIAALIPRAVRGLSAGFYDERQIASGIRWIFGPDTQLVADGTYFVVEADGAVVACGGWSRRRTVYGGDQAKHGDDPPLDPAVDAARIRAFFVDPARARRGLGSLLLAASVDAARAAGFRAVELVATLPGEPLYRAHGFVVVERFVDLLPDGVPLPVVRMRRALPD